MVEKTYVHLSVGNFNIDIAIYLDRIPEQGETLLASDLNIRPGGAATNYAVVVSQYGHRAYLLSSVSIEELVRSNLNYVKEKGVFLDYIKYVDQPPGIVIILVQPGGERSMIKYLGANKELTAEDIPHKLLDEAHVVHMASIPLELAEGISKKCRPRSLVVTYDPGVYAVELLNKNLELLKYVDVLFLNEREFSIVARKTKSEVLFKYGLSMLVVKMGQRGAVVSLPSGLCYQASTQPIKKPLDTTGAGDAFDALFNAKYIESKDPALALAYGVAAGALKVGYKGSFLPLDLKLFKMQLEKTIVEKKAECLLKQD